MTRNTFPNKTGEYEIDGISIIVLSDKIIVDTGGRTTARLVKATKKKQSSRTGSSSKNSEKKEKEGGLRSGFLDGATDFALNGFKGSLIPGSGSKKR